MSGSVFDTNVLSKYIEPRAKERYPELVQLVAETLRAEGIYISSVGKYELRRGVRKLRLQGQGRRKEVAVERILDAAHVLGVDALAGAAWDAAAELWAKAAIQKPSIQIDDADLIIAATALVHGRTFVTCDGKLIDRLKEVGYTGEVKLLTATKKT